MSARGEQLVRDLKAVDAPFDEVLIAGLAAGLADTKSSLGSKLPLALGLIVFATFVLLFLFIGSADTFIGGTLRDDTKIATALQANTGLRKRSLNQIAVLATGFARVVLILVAALLALAPWGLDSTDVFTSVRSAFFGFKVGDVTISLSTIALAERLAERIPAVTP